MRYRRNADSGLRELERRYLATGSFVDLETLNHARRRLAMPIMPYPRDYVRSFLDGHTEDFRSSVISYESLNIHNSMEDYHQKLNQYGDDSRYQVKNCFMAFEVKRNILFKLGDEDVPAGQNADLLDEVYEEIIEACHNMGWPTVLDKIVIPFNGDWGSRMESRISDFLSERGRFDFKRIKSHQDISDLFELTALEQLYERELDGYELEDAEQYERTLHNLFDRGRLNRKLYIASPHLLNTTGDISFNSRRHGVLLANHLPRYETYMHNILVERPSTSIHDPKYAVWSTNIQSPGPSGGDYSSTYDEAVQNYLKRLLKIR